MSGILRQTQRAISLFALRPRTCGPTAAAFPGKLAEACVSGEARFFAKKATEVIPAAKRPPGRPRKPEKEPWQTRVPSAYSRFVKEAYAEAARDVSSVKNATSVMPSIAKMWREAPQSQKDRLQREYEKELAARPKKPPAKGSVSGWTLFVRENYARVAGDHPTVPARGIFAEVSKVWKSLSRAEVADYTERAARENAARRSAKAQG